MSIACRILGHRWYYLLSEVGYVPLHGWPQGTRCQRCGAPHPRPLPAPALAEPVAERVTLPLPEHAPDEHLHLPSGLDRREVAVWYHGHGCGWQAARAALAEQEADGPAVPEGREPAAVTEGPSDEELLATINKATADFPPSHPQAQPLNVLEYQLALELCKARAVLARWGQPPDPPAEGEVAEMLLEIEQLAHEANLRGDATCYAWHRAAELLERLARWGNHFPDATKMVPPSEGEATGVIDAIADCLQADASSSTILDRIAALLERHAAPVPVPGVAHTRYEFSVCDETGMEVAGGSAPTYAQALSEGRHYLAQYQQDEPHALELRRVEVLDPDALPLPQGGEVE